VTCASPAYIATHGTPATPRQIAGEQMPVISYASPTSGLVHPMAFLRGKESIALHRLGAGATENLCHVSAQPPPQQQSEGIRRLGQYVVGRLSAPAVSCGFLNRPDD
jgi:hypothetical protein